MKPENFTGQCKAESTFNGNPVGTNFSSTDVAFDQRAFEASDGNRRIQIAYHEELKPGVHDLVFSGNSDELPSFEYNAGAGFKKLSGTAKVTIGENLDSQSGSFDVAYFDDINRLISFKGSFDALYEVKKS